MRWLCGVAVLVAGWLGTQPAGAQSPAPIDWSGVYLGAGLGGAVGVASTAAAVGPNSTYLTTTDPAQIADAGDGRITQWRPSGGLMVGYGRQFGNLLVGLEATANTLFLDESRSASQVYQSAAPSRFVLDQRIEADWQAAVRPRLGWAQDNWLAFVSAGLAVTRLTVETTFSDDFGGSAASGHDAATETRLGWTLGMGGEIALDGNWSFRADYLYADFGRVDTAALVTNPASAGNSSVLESSADLRTHTVLVGLTYRFGGF